MSVNCCCFCSRTARYSSDKPSTVPTQLPRQYTLAQGLAVYIRDGVQSWKSCDARSKRADGSSSSRSSGEHQMSTQYVLGLDEDGSDGRDGPRPNLLNASPTIKKGGEKKKKCSSSHQLTLSRLFLSPGSGDACARGQPF